MLDAAAQAQLREVRRLIDAGALERAYALCHGVHTQHKRSPEPHLLVAEICLARNAPPAALNALATAQALGGAVGRCEALRANALYRLRRIGEAIAAARRALAAETDDAEALLLVGGVLMNLGKTAEAVSAFRTAYARDPDAARLHLATAEHVSGALEDAEAHYRAALAADRNQALVWFSLTQLRKGALSDADAAEVRTLLARSGNHEDALMLAHALAKSQEDAGDYVGALETLVPVKHAARASFGYAFDAWDVPMFEAARDTTPSPPPTAAGDQREGPVFVLGLPRTGTTLVERILVSHPEAETVDEVDDFAVAVSVAAGVGPRGVYSADALKAGVAADRAAIGAHYLQSLAEREASSPRVVDKMPLNFYFAGLIHQALPNARIVCLRRGAMDSCIANYMQFVRADSSRYAYQLDLGDVARHYAAFDDLIAHWRAVLPPDRFMELQYEHLVRDQEGETRRLLDFCGLPFDERCLAFHENPSAVMTASTVQVRQPLYASSIGRWKRYGSAVQPALDVLAEKGIGTDAPE